MFLPLVEWTSLHEILRALPDQIVPIYSGLTQVATGIAGLGALLYIAYRVWQALARAEPVDVFPLLRPFVIGLCIVLFQPLVVGTLNGVLRPLVEGTHQIMRDQVLNMNEWQDRKDRLQWENDMNDSVLGVMMPNKEYDEELKTLQYSPRDQQVLDVMYQIHNVFSLEYWAMEFLRWLLEILFETASLIIDVIRTFYLMVLAIFGPLAFAFSIFDGFQSTLVQWFSRYITVYLWLPVADLFSAMLAKLQALSLEREVEQIGSIQILPDAANSIYIVFMVIGIFGYFCVPSVASWIVQASGLGAYNRRISGVALSVTNMAAGVAGATTGNIAGRVAGR